MKKSKLPGAARQGVSRFIREHEERLKKASFDRDFLSFHLEQTRFLQHERLVHLLVMLFVMAVFLVFFILYFIYGTYYFLLLFLLCLILAVAYVFHYFKLENTVIKWYFIYNEQKKVPGEKGV
jgi:predicted RND superfamily exporter protein